MSPLDRTQGPVPGGGGPHSEGSSLSAGAAAPAEGEPITSIPHAIPAPMHPTRAEEEDTSPSSNVRRVSGTGFVGSELGHEDPLHRISDSNPISLEFPVERPRVPHGPRAHADVAVGGEATGDATGEAGAPQVPDHDIPSGAEGPLVGTVQDSGPLCSGDQQREGRRHAEDFSKGMAGGLSAPHPDAVGFLATPARRRRAGATRYRQPCLCCGLGEPHMGDVAKNSGENGVDDMEDRTRVLPLGGGRDPFELFSSAGPGLLDFA